MIKVKTLLAVCASVKGTEQLYLTDKRVVLHEIKSMASNVERSIPLESISSINISSKLANSTIEIVSSGNKAITDHVPMHVSAIEDLKQLKRNFLCTSCGSKRKRYV